MRLEASTEPAVTSDLTQSAAWGRLEDQIGWYDRKSTYNQHLFKLTKVAQIVVAALVPILAAGHATRSLLGALGAIVLILEGVQQLFQYQQNWLTYRSTCESLKHEKYLYLSAAGSYANALRPQALLSERVEGLVSQEHAKWTAAKEELRVQDRIGAEQAT